MSVGLEGPPPIYSEPPADRQAMTLGDHLRAAAAMIAQDRQITEDEKRELQLFMVALEEIGQMQAQAGAVQVQPGDGMLQPGESQDAGDFGGEDVMADQMASGAEPY